MGKTLLKVMINSTVELEKSIGMVCSSSRSWGQAKEPSPSGRVLVSQARISSLWKPGSANTECVG